MNIGEPQPAAAGEELRWVKVARLGDVAVGSARRVEVAGRGIAIFRLAERDLCAVDDACPHAGFSLSQGDVKGRQVRCLLHAWTFSLDDGRCTFGARDLHAWQVRIDEDEILIAVPTHDDRERKAVREAIIFALGSGDFASLEGLVERAMAASLPVEEGLALARAASPAALLPAQAAIGEALGLLPGLSRGDALLAALTWALRHAELGNDAPSPPLLVAPSRLPSRGLGARHQRRRLIAMLERHDAVAAFEVALAYLADGHTPLWLAQDLVRRAFDLHPHALIAALAAARVAYGWPRDHAALARAIAVVATASSD